MDHDNDTGRQSAADREFRYSQFIGLLARHDQAIRRFVRSLLPSRDVSMSGQWLHLAAVYDPAGRRVSQYVNGRLVSREDIIDQFPIETLRIGPAEIGNWGQPFRKTPWLSVRNLNGTIDELAIFNAALTDERILSLYEQGKLLGY